MSNPYRNTPGVRYFQVPQALIETLPYIAHADLKLLCFVQSESQRMSKVTLELQGAAVAQRTGIHPSCIGEARRNLVQMGLLVAEKKGKAWFYTISDPETKKPVIDANAEAAPLVFTKLPRRVLEQYFRPLLRKCRPSENGLTGCCPFPSHEDKNPSFSVSLNEGSGGLWTCRGCSRQGNIVDFEVCRSERLGGVVIDSVEAHRKVLDRLHSLGVMESSTGICDLIYPYHDEMGELISETVRLGSDKHRTVQRRPHPEHPHLRINNTKGCRKVLYRLPEIMEADTIILVEGEPDCEAVRSLHLVDEAALPIAVTTSSSGAGAWHPEYTRQLRGKFVILVGHNDPDGKGLRYMEAVCEAIEGSVRGVLHRSLPHQFGDVDEYLRQHTAEDFIGLIGEDLLELAPDF